MGQLKKVGAPLLNARIRLPLDGTTSPWNLLNKMARYTKVPDLHNSLTYLPECLPLLVAAMQARRTGTLHFVNPEPVSTAFINPLISNWTIWSSSSI